MVVIILIPVCVAAVDYVGGGGYGHFDHDGGGHADYDDEV